MVVGDTDRLKVTAGEFLLLMTVSPRINWTNCMDNVLRLQPSAGGDHRFSGRQALNFPDNLFALGENRRSAGTMNGAVHAASAKQGRIRGINDGLSCFFRDVGRTMELHGLAAVEQQAHCELAWHVGG